MAGKLRPRSLREGQRSEAERLFRTAVALQGAFWDSLFDLERALGVGIDESRDLSDWNVDLLREGAEDDCGRVSWLDRSA